MDCPENSRCFDCAHRTAGRLCIAVPRPEVSERLRTGQVVAHCPSYLGPQGELTAIEGTTKPRSSLGIRF